MTTLITLIIFIFSQARVVKTHWKLSDKMEILVYLEEKTLLHYIHANILVVQLEDFRRFEKGNLGGFIVWIYDSHIDPYLVIHCITLLELFIWHFGWIIVIFLLQP